MPIRKIERGEITIHLNALGLRQGMKVVVHSSLRAFGSVKGRTTTFIEELRQALGDKGTLAVPTFTFKLTPEDVFDPATTPSMTGALAEAVRRLPDARRSACPIHSYAAIGRDAALVEQARADRSFGAGSCFDLFLREGFHWLQLGCGHFGHACTLVHHTEMTFGVPYREWVDVPRRVRRPDGRIEHLTVRYFARRAGVEPKPIFAPVRDRMIAEGSMIAVPAPAGMSCLAPAEKIHTTGLTILQRDPWGLVH